MKKCPGEKNIFLKILTLGETSMEIFFNLIYLFIFNFKNFLLNFTGPVFAV